MLTAVIEHQGPVVRFNEQFLEFLRPFHITPIACNVRQPQEKGKVEKGAIHYIRTNFWPLRTCTNLDDLQAQAHHWRDQVANRRVHRTTGWRPIERFRPAAMRPLPAFLPDGRDTAVAKGHHDVAIHFDGNTYSAPPWAIAKTRTVNVDHHHVTLSLKDKAIATPTHCWGRNQRWSSPSTARPPRSITPATGSRRQSPPVSPWAPWPRPISNPLPPPSPPCKKVSKSCLTSKRTLAPTPS
jgi:hypothetical protein